MFVGVKEFSLPEKKKTNFSVISQRSKFSNTFMDRTSYHYVYDIDLFERSFFIFII